MSRAVDAPAFAVPPLTERERAVLSSAPTQMFLAGEWLDAARGFVVEDPASGAPLCEVAAAGPREGEAALAAAASVQDAWAPTPTRTRSEILRAAFEQVRAQADRFTVLMSLESGKTVAEARAELEYGAEFLRWYAEEAVRPEGDYRMGPTGDKRVLTSAHPVGPCLLITPWNFPLAMLTRKVGPALAAGCTAIVKPAGQTPLTALAFAQVLEDCGLPKGVLSVLPTDRSGELAEPLLTDRRLRKLSFTGSTEVGRRLAERAARNLMRTSMELGGNAPFLVFADADLEGAVDAAVLAKLRNTGQSCTAANWFLVQEEVAEPFVSRLVERLTGLRLGRGTDPATDVGPLIDGAACARVHDLVVAAVGDGARVLVGGAAGDGDGHFYPPTVLADVAVDAAIVRTEIFGPVAPVCPFATEDEAVRLANATDSGLVAYVHTRRLDRALRVADRLEAGMVGVNRGMVSEASAPFGGVKQSGLGREGGGAGLREYQELKYLAVAA
jgi:succinate-semialdehyde dehydrogenase/glutarate-semialdehyde dehydrogenase